MAFAKRPSNMDDTGKLVLRVLLAVLLLFHGVAKLMHGVDMIGGMLAKMGLPAALQYLVYVGEVVAPVLVLLGLWTRAAAFVIVINMVVAVVLVHLGQLFDVSKQGGWALELQGFYFGTALALCFLGAGRFSVGGSGGRLN